MTFYDWEGTRFYLVKSCRIGQVHSKLCFLHKKAARPHSRPTPAAVGVPALGGDYGSGGVGPRVALPGAGSHIGLSQGYCILCAAEGPYQ